MNCYCLSAILLWILGGNRAVSYMNTWWRHEELHYEKTTLDKVLKYKVKGDTDECLLIGENLIYYIENKDERMFACFSALYKLKDIGLKDQGLRYRRKDATYLWFQIIEIIWFLINKQYFNLP